MSTPYYNASTSGTAPVVVQGTLVDNPYGSNANAAPISTDRIYDHRHASHGVGSPDGITVHNEGEFRNDNGGNWTKGEVQPRRCNDAAFAFMFVAHLGAMAWVAATFAPRIIGDVAEGVGGGNRDLLMDSVGEEEGDVLVGGGDESLDMGGHEPSGLGNKFATLVARAASHLVTSAVHLAYSSDFDDHDVEGTGGRGLQEDNANAVGANDLADVMLLLGASAAIALAISTGALGVMISHAESLIRFALLFNIASTAVVSSCCACAQTTTSYCACLCT